MHGSDYSIPSLTISSGGEEEMSSSNYKLQDIKGQGVIGVESSTNFNAELGGIYGLGVPIVKIEGVPYGTVQLNIERDGDNIRVSWDPAIRNPQIFVRSGDGSGQYVNDGDATVWVEIGDLATEFDVHMSESYVLHLDQVAAGYEEAYYKGLQSGVARGGANPDTGDTNLASAWAVGKNNYTFSGGNNFFNYPFSKDADVNTVFSRQYIDDSGTGMDYPGGCRVYLHNYSAGNFDYSEFSEGTWSSLTLRVSAGNIFYNSGTSNLNVTLVGRVMAETADIYRCEGGNNLIGLIYPQGELITSFTNAASNDRLLIRNVSGSFDPVDYSTAWADPSYRLIPTMGYWYYRDPRNLTLDWQQTLD